MKQIKTFLNKPTSEATNSDVLITHAATVTIGIVVGSALTLLASRLSKDDS